MNDTKIAIREAFFMSMKSCKSKDDTIYQMLEAGATFSEVPKLYNEFMIEAGLKLSSEDKNIVLDECLTSGLLDTEDGFKKAIKEVVNRIIGCNEKQASYYIRTWCRKNDVECYRKTTGPGSRNPFVKRFYLALIENPGMTKEELELIISELEPEQQINPLRWFSQHNNVRIMVNNVLYKLQGE